MLKGIIAMGILASLLGCGIADGRPEGATDDDIRRAALDIVYPLPECDKSWFGGTVAKCDAAQLRLNEKRKQYENFDPLWMRKAILRWLDYSQNIITEAREDCITNKSRRELDEYTERTKAERESSRAVLKSIGR